MKAEEANMERLLLWLGRGAGIAGALICALAGVMRLAGAYWLGSFQLGTLLLAGLALMTLGCVCLLTVLTERVKAAR
jgi:hypothetical protein